MSAASYPSANLEAPNVLPLPQRPRSPSLRFLHPINQPSLPHRPEQTYTTQIIHPPTSLPPSITTAELPRNLPSLTKPGTLNPEKQRNPAPHETHIHTKPTPSWWEIHHSGKPDRFIAICTNVLRGCYAFTLPSKPYHRVSPAQKSSSVGPPEDLDKGLSPLASPDLYIEGYIVPGVAAVHVRDFRDVEYRVEMHVEFGVDKSLFGHDMFLDLVGVGGCRGF